jgi:SM-20-related protein
VFDTQRSFDLTTDPFTIHLADNVLSAERVAELSATAPIEGFERIEMLDPRHEKQYAMNLRYLQKDSEKDSRTNDLSTAWLRLVDALCGEDFLDWLEKGTNLSLRTLPTDIGIYTHNDGDYISVHKDKPNKAITAILYLNPEWPQSAGGAYEVRTSKDPAVEPVRLIRPKAGRFLAFPPTDRSWHSVSRVTSGTTRLTVQLEFWLDPTARGH